MVLSMKLEYDQQKIITFYLIFGFYFMIYFGIGIIPANIENLLLALPGTSEFGISVIITLILVINMVRMLFFGYYSDLLINSLSHKKLFVITNALWIVSYGLSSLTINYHLVLISICMGVK